MTAPHFQPPASNERNVEILARRFSSHREIYDLAAELSSHFPQSETVISGIYELLLNALEHGNLEIGDVQKEQLLRAGEWEKEVSRREQDPTFSSRVVEVTLRQVGDMLSLSIADQGKGFNWRHYLQRSVTLEAIHGRGLLIVRSCGFDDLSFNEAGNEVRVGVRLSF